MNDEWNDNNNRVQKKYNENMDKKYKELIDILNENNLTKVSYENKSKKYTVERSAVSTNNPVSEKPVETNLLIGIEVKAPILGTFCQAPAPGKKPFTKVGEKVKKGQTLFIIEAMKVLNEIVAPTNGTVKEIKFKNGELVQFDDTVMIIEE